MCNACLSKTQKTQYDDPELVKLQEELGVVVLDFMDDFLFENIDNFWEDIPLTKTLFSDFLQGVSNVLQKIYIFGQKQVVKNASEEVKASEAIAQLATDVSFDVAPDHAVQYAEYQAWLLVTNFSESAQKKLQEIVTSSINEGWTRSELASVIKREWSDFSSTRATLIARQETAMALGAWKYKQFQESASQFWQNWRKRAQTTQDDKVRPEHKANEDAWWIPYNETFPWTWSMHEPFGFNCRCVTSYRFFLPDEL